MLTIARFKLFCLRDARVEVQLAAVTDNPIRMQPCRMILHQPVRIRLHADAVRIEPGVEFHVPLVRFFYHEGQRVITRILPLHTGEPLRPWRVLGWIERVRGRLDLHDNGVHAACLQAVN